MTLEECCRHTTARLCERYPRSEAEWMVRIIFEHLKNYSRVDLIIKAKDEVSDYIACKVAAIADRLLKGEPLQYILGEARFYGLRLRVTTAVLIPRPETEQMVDMIVADANGASDLRVADICTGSGCIAVALARNLPFSSVTAIDISEPALEVARSNADSTATKISFQQADALTLTLPGSSMDIIVSNPPYIAECERATMDSNVLDHEPEIALFVPNNDPLKFYTAISRTAFEALKPGGRLYFEINPLFANDLRSDMISNGWCNVELHRDMQRQYRFLTASRPQK